MKDTFIPDASQQEVIDVDAGYHLVLAPPGCGKTQILTERIRKAHQQGVLYEDMLCLTFTNRAARGMQERTRMWDACLWVMCTDSVASFFMMLE